MNTLHIDKMDHKELLAWLNDLQHRAQQIHNTEEIIRAELAGRVKAEPLPLNYTPGSG